MLISIASALCVFTPPDDWKPLKPSALSKQFQIGFVGSGSSGIRPSIHLATEAVNCTLEEYVKAVQSIHKSRPKTQWRDLGPFQMLAGTGRLTEIQTRSPSGNTVLFQAIFLQEQTAYVLTASVAKEDLCPKRQEIFSALASLELFSNITAAIQDEAVRAQFAEFFEKREHIHPDAEWAALQQMVERDAPNLGKYWQFLALQEGRAKIYSEARNRQ